MPLFQVHFTYRRTETESETATGLYEAATTEECTNRVGRIIVRPGFFTVRDLPDGNPHIFDLARLVSVKISENTKQLPEDWRSYLSPALPDLPATQPADSPKDDN